MRNDIYHDGLTLEEIQQKMRKNPIDIIVKFKPFLYQIILEFLGFTDEFFFFDSGFLINKESSKKILNVKKIMKLWVGLYLAQELEKLL